MIAALHKLALQIIETHKKSFLTFLMAGIGTTSIYIGIFSLLWYVIHTNHIVAASVAFVCSASFQFFSNRKITFKVKEGRLSHQILKYFTLLAINYLISVSTLQLSIWLIASPFVGVMASVCITPFTGYLLFRYWVFRRPLKPSLETHS